MDPPVRKLFFQLLLINFSIDLIQYDLKANSLIEAMHGQTTKCLELRAAP